MENYFKDDNDKENNSTNNIDASVPLTTKISFCLLRFFVFYWVASVAIPVGKWMEFVCFIYFIIIIIIFFPCR